MFSQDRNLLSFEPAVFSRCYWPQQILATGTASVTGTTLTAAGGNFLAAQIKPGHVVVLEGTTPYEIVAVPSATTLTVSLVRMAPDQPALPLAPLTEVNYRVATFDPQHAELERILLARLGITREAAAELALGDLFTLTSTCGVLAAIYRTSSTGAVNSRTGVVSDDWAAVKARLYESYYRSLLRLVCPVPTLTRK